MTAEAHDFEDIREEVRKLCADFPGEYWRKLDREAAYPAEFVKALGDAGYLAALIPAEYGGSGLPLSAAAAILEEVQRAGCNGGACHAQMYIMGALLRHGNEAQKQRFLPKIAAGELRLQAFGITEPTSGTDTSSIKTTAVRAATAMWSTARRSGHRGPSTPISCCCWRGRRPRSRSRSAPTACRSSFSTCRQPGPRG